MICEKFDSILARYVAENSKIMGVMVLVLSTTFASVSGLLCKMSSLNGVEASWAMGVVGICISIATFCAFQDQKLKILITRSYLYSLANGIVLRGVGTYVYFLSLDYASATDSLVVVLFVSIVWSTFLEAARMEIRPHWLAVLSSIVGLIGMILMCKPDGFSNMDLDLTYLKGVLLACVSGCFGSTYYVNVNKLSNIPALWHWVGYPIGLMFLTKPEISINKFELTSCSAMDRVVALLAVLCQLLGGLTAIIGTQLTLASVSFVVKLFGILLTFLLQVMLLPSPISMNSLLGGVCIVVAMGLQFAVLSKKRSNNVAKIVKVEVNLSGQVV